MPAGINSLHSRYSVEESVERLTALLSAKHVKLFCVIDHSGEATAAGLDMRPTKLLLFGSAAAGTPLMIAAPSSALDLPLRILVAEEADGRVLLSWNEPSWMQERHLFPKELMSHIVAAQSLAHELAQDQQQ